MRANESDSRENFTRANSEAIATANGEAQATAKAQAKTTANAKANSATAKARAFSLYKAKYFVIALLLAVVAITSVGVSKWNIHIQQIYSNNFSYVNSETANTSGGAAGDPILTRYLTINYTETAQDDPNATASGTKTAFYRDTLSTEQNPNSKQTTFTYNGGSFKVEVSDGEYGDLQTDENGNYVKDANGNYVQNNPDASPWSEWEDVGLGFTYAYKRTARINLNGEIVGCSEPLTGDALPTNAGKYQCVITATTTPTATDAAIKAAEQLNYVTNPNDGTKCAAEISFTIKQRGITVSVANKTSTYGENHLADNPLTATTDDVVANTENTTDNNLSPDLNKIVRLYTTKTEDGKTSEYELERTSPAGKYGIEGSALKKGATDLTSPDSLINDNYDVTFVYPGEATQTQGVAFNGEREAEANPLALYVGAGATAVASLNNTASNTAVSTANNSASNLATVSGVAGKPQAQPVANGGVALLGGESPATGNVNGTYTITTREVTLEWGNVTSFVYTGAAQKPTATAGNLVNNDSVTVTVTAKPDTGSQTTPDGKAINVGNYVLTVTLPTTSDGKCNYIWKDATGDAATAPKTLNFDITPAEITNPQITPYSGTYDGEEHPVTTSVTATTVNSQTLSYKYSTDGTTWSDTLTIKNAESIIFSVKLSAPNHGDKIIENKIATVSKRPVTVTIADKSSTYGEPVALTAQVTSKHNPAIVPDDKESDIYTLYITDQNAVVELSTTTDAGTYAITGNQNQGFPAQNYDITFVGTGENGTKGVYTIKPAEITKPQITPYSGTYDGKAHDVTTKVSATTVNDQQITVEYKTNNDDWTSTIPTITDAGSVTFNVRISAPNHNTLTLTESYTATINKAELTATASSHTITYGDNAPSYSITYSGFVNGETDTTAAGFTAPTISCNYQKGSPVTTDGYAVTLSGGSATNYSFKLVNGKVTVNKATLTVKANDASVNMGQEANFTYTITGFVNGETEVGLRNANALTGTVAFTCGYNKDETNPDNVNDTYDIIPDETDLSATNYTFTTEKGTLTVNKNHGITKPTADTTVFTYDGSAQTYTPGGFDTATMNITGNEKTDAGDYIVKVTPKDGYVWRDFVNNNTEEITFTFTITPKSVTITWGDTTFTYNGAAQAPSATTTGFIGSDSLTLTIKDSNGNIITEVKNAGSYTAVATFSQNYTTTSETTKSFTIGKKPLTITLLTQKDKITYGESYTTFGITHTLSGLCEQDNADGLITYKLKAGVTLLELKDYLDVNTYFVIPQIADTLSQNYELTFSSYTVTVEPLKIKFDSSVISKSYSATGIALSDVFNSSTFAATYEKDKDNPKIDVAYSSIASAILRNYADTSTNDVHNVSAGRLKYTLDNTSKKIAGSTYGITLSFSKNNFNNYNYTLTGSNAYLKYLTAIVNGGYYTIEDAIAQSGTIITLAGNSTNETSYIVTAFSKLGLSGGSFAAYKTNYNYTLSGKQLVVPFDSSTDYFKGENTTLTETVYSALVVPQGIILDFISKSKLYVGGFVGTPSDGGRATIRTHGVLMNNGTINLSSGCEFFSFGYTKSASADSPGIITAQNGVTIKEFMVMYDWPGGSVASDIYKKVFPINRWSLHNISCKLKVYAGATHYAYTAVSMRTSLISDARNYLGIPDVLIIGKISESNTDNQNCLFKPSSNATSSDYLLKYAVGSDELYTIVGSNCKEGQKDITEIEGRYEDSTLRINVTVSIASVKMETSHDISAPLSYMDVIVKSGATLALNKSDYVFMKTAKLEVENGATVNIGSNIDVAFIDNAYAMIKGTVSGSGNIGGLIKTSSAGALLEVNNAATYTMKSGSSASTGNTIQAKGVQTAGGSATTLNSGNYSSVGSPGSYYWVPDDRIKTVTFNYDDGTGATYTTTVILTKGSDGSYSYTLQSGDFPTDPARNHYTFDGWFTGTNGTSTQVSADYTITDNITLHAKWTPETYTITYHYVGDKGTQLTQEQLNSITNPANNTTDNYSYGSGFTLPVPESTNTNMQFVSWYSDSACTQTITAISDTDFGDKVLYGKWTAETPKNYNITLQSGKTEVTLATSTLTARGTEESGANYKIPDINATWASKTAVLNQEFMNSTNFSIIKEEGHYNFDSYFIGWELTYTLNGSTSTHIYKEATPQIEIHAGATDITLTALWEQKAILNFSFITTKDVVLKTTTKYFSPNMSFPSTLIETLLTAFATSGESTEAFTHYQFDYYYVGDDNTTQNQDVNFTSPGQSVNLHAVYRRDYLIKVAGNNITLTNPNGVYVDWKTTPTEYNVSALFSINQGYYDVPADVTANHGTVTYNAEDAKYYLNLTGVDSANDVTVTIVTKELVKIAFTINGTEISSLAQYRKPGDTVNFANISYTQATDYDITSNAQYFTGNWTLNGVTYSATGSNTTYTVGESNATFVAVLANKATVQITMKSQGGWFSGYQTAECNFKYKKEDNSFGTEYCKYKYKVIGSDEGKEKWTFYLNPEQTFTIEPINGSTINTPANNVTPVAGQTHSYTVTSKK